MCLAAGQFETCTDCIPRAFHLFWFYLCEYRKKNSVEASLGGGRFGIVVTKAEQFREDMLATTTQRGTQDHRGDTDNRIQVEVTLYTPS